MPYLKIKNPNYVGTYVNDNLQAVSTIWAFRCKQTHFQALYVNFFYKFLQEKKYFVPGKTRVNHDKEPFLTEVQTCMWLNEKTNFKH